MPRLGYGTISDLWVNPDCGLKTRDYRGDKEDAGERSVRREEGSGEPVVSDAPPLYSALITGLNNHNNSASRWFLVRAG